MSVTQDYGNVGSAPVNHGYSVVSIIRAIIIGGIAVWIVSFAYGPISHWSPDARLNFVIAAAYGYVVSRIVNAMLKHQKICDALPALIVAGVLGLLAIWTAWLSYLWTLINYNFSGYLDFLLHPTSIWKVMQAIAHYPIWTLSKNSSGSPILYYGVWVVELAIVVGLPMLMALSYIRENKVCDDCRDWLRKTEDIARFLLPDGNDVQTLADLQRGDVSALPALSRLAGDDETPAWIEAHGYACPNCQNRDSYVTTYWIFMKQVKKSKPERVTEILSRYVPVSVEMEKAIFEPTPGAASATGQG